MGSGGGGAAGIGSGTIESVGGVVVAESAG